jgi:hypothetical protein
MKKTTLVWTFAACAGALAAQTQEPARPTKPTPSQEIATIVAVEEQEGDLAKAEKLYKEALAGTKLSADAKELATLRLAELLMRLGRRDDAKAVMQALNVDKGVVVSLDDVTVKPQDREREAALRAKARELVKEADEKRGATGTPTPLFGVDAAVAEQLLWIGQPAVPEVIAYLERLPKANGNHHDLARGLTAFLWRVGGDQAKAFLQQAQSNGMLRDIVASSANAATTSDMLEIAEAYLRLPDPEVAESVLGSFGYGNPLCGRLAPEVVTEVMGQGSVRQRTWLLTRCRDGFVAKAPKLMDVVRAAMASTEPVLGTAAQSLLTSERFRNDPDAIEMVLDAFDSPLLRDRHLPFPNDRVEVSAERARSWLPKLEACVAGAGTYHDGSRHQWLLMLLWLVHEHTDASALPGILRCLDLGYPCAGLLKGRVTKDNARDVFARFDRVPKDHLKAFLAPFGKIGLPAEMFADLRARFDAMVAAEPGNRSGLAQLFLQPMVRTGNPDAAAWIVVEWHAIPDSDRDRWAVDALLDLVRRSQDEKVRVAMRALASADVMFPDRRGQLLLALLAMHDEQALDLAFRYAAESANSFHPFGGTDGFRGKPILWLLQKEPKPPHRYTEAEVLGLLERVGKTGAMLLAPTDAAPDQIEDRMLMALVRHQGMPVAFNGDWTSWAKVVMDLVDARGNQGPLADLVRDAIARSMHARDLIAKAHRGTVIAFAETLKAELGNADEDAANVVLDKLLNADVAVDLPNLLQHRHAKLRRQACSELHGRNREIASDTIIRLLNDPDRNVRETACWYSRDRALQEAVPALLTLLRDPDAGVQKIATDALTRIRFVHDQKAHWDRITKGLDASPNSAAEKLLLQAKPGEPKAQRLLAITSLGTLGVPEALPFLIDWTKDSDAEIHTAATAAITQIHLNPRR